MTTNPIHRRTGALALAIAVAATTAVAGLAAPAAAEPVDWQSHVDVAPDYLVDTFDLLADHVFETVTFERFEWLLNGKYDDNTTEVTGRFAFLVGGAHDPSITSTIGYIDQVAKQYGVDTIYQFDPALDGSTYNVWNTSALNLAPAGKTAIENLGNRLIDNSLNKDTTPAFTKTSSDPYLFIYDKTHKVDVGGVPTEDRIVSSLNVRTTASALAAPGAVDAYKAQVAAVFDAASVGGVAQLDELDQFTFFKGEVNRRHKLGYPNAATNGGNILADSDDTEDWRIQSITYAELKHLLQQDGDYVILFGGTWCHNTRAVLKQINREAQENGVEKVYIFDNSLDSTGNGGSNYLHIRDNASLTGSPALPLRASYLYGDIWNTYLSNVKTQYRTAAGEAWTGSVSPVQFYPGGDTTQPVQLARKGQVPFLLQYNKDNVSGGTAAPVVSQWIRTNAAGSGWTEYMTEWWLTPTGGNLSGNATAQAFGAEAEAALETFFDDLPGIAAITTVEAVASNAGGGAVTLTATVSWCNSVALDAAGTVEFFRPGASGQPAVSLGSTSSFTLGQASVTVDDWGSGDQEFYAVYTPSAGSDYRTATSETLTYALPATVPAAPATPTASVSGSSVTISWTAPANGGSAITGYKVSLDGGTPVTVGAGVTSYTFTGVAVGGHSGTVVATNSVGDSVASGASNSVTVAEPPAEPTAPEAPAAPTASVSGSSVTVSWSAPANGGSAITGYKVSLDGGTPVAVGAGVISHTFTGVAVGAHTATVIATNAVGDSAASAASNSVTVVAVDEPEEPVDPSTVKGTVTVTGELHAGGTVTVTGTGFAESTEGFDVEIHSTPQLLGTVGTDADGAFTLTATIPATLPAGSHSIVVLYDGVEITSAAVSVAADPSLAATGSDAASLVSLTVAGLATLVLGGLVAAGVGITRRRQAA